MTCENTWAQDLRPCKDFKELDLFFLAEAPSGPLEGDLSRAVVLNDFAVSSL